MLPRITVWPIWFHPGPRVSQLILLGRNVRQQKYGKRIQTVAITAHFHTSLNTMFHQKHAVRWKFIYRSFTTGVLLPLGWSLIDTAVKTSEITVTFSVSIKEDSKIYHDHRCKKWDIIQFSRWRRWTTARLKTSRLNISTQWQRLSVITSL